MNIKKLCYTVYMYNTNVPNVKKSMKKVKKQYTAFLSFIKTDTSTIEKKKERETQKRQ